MHVNTHSYRQDIVSTVRAELARAGHPIAALTPVLGLDKATVYSRMQGRTPFTTDELYLIGEFLGIEPFDLLPRSQARLQVSA